MEADWMTETTWDTMRDVLFDALEDGTADRIDYEGFLDQYGSYDRYVGSHGGERNDDRPMDVYGGEAAEWPAWYADRMEW